MIDCGCRKKPSRIKFRSRQLIRKYTTLNVRIRTEFTFGDNKKIFQVTATIIKKYLYGNNGWERNLVRGPKWDLAGFLNKFYRRFKKNSNVCLIQPVRLSRDIFADDNEWLTKKLSESEVWQAVRQTDPLKALRPYSMHPILFTKNAEISSVRQFIILLKLFFIMNIY